MFWKRRINTIEVPEPRMLDIPKRVTSVQFKEGYSDGEHAQLEDNNNICLECGSDVKPAVVKITYTHHSYLYTPTLCEFHRWKTSPKKKKKTDILS